MRAPSLVVLFGLLHGGNSGCMHTGTTLHLTELNWDDEVVKSDKLLHVIEFSSPWCIWSGTHSCDDMTEAWKELGKDYDGDPDILIAEVDCSRWPGHDEDGYSIKGPCQIHDIKEYPTVRVFNPALGPHGANYSGAATLDGLKAFVAEKFETLCKLKGPDLEPAEPCSSKEVRFANQWLAKPLSETQKELSRMLAVFTRASEDRSKEVSALVSWMGARINILKQIVRHQMKQSKDEL